MQQKPDWARTNCTNFKATASVSLSLQKHGSVSPAQNYFAINQAATKNNVRNILVRYKKKDSNISNHALKLRTPVLVSDYDNTFSWDFLWMPLQTGIYGRETGLGRIRRNSRGFAAGRCSFVSMTTEICSC